MNLNRLTLLLLLVAIVVRSDLFFMLLYLVGGLQLITRLWLWYEARYISWRRDAPVAAFPGEQTLVEIEIHNRGLLPIPWLALHESLPPVLHSPPMIREVLALHPREKRTIRYTLAGRRRGFYQLGPLSIQTGDVLGLGERPLVSGEHATFTIYPEILPLTSLGLPASLPYGTIASARRLFEDPARPAGVRPYQPSDGVRRIDWKTSAHSGQAVVRRNQTSIALETLVALAFSREEYEGRFPYDTMEHALTAAAAIIAHLASLRQPFGICANGRDPLSGQAAQRIPIGTGRAHFMAVLGLLGRLETMGEGQILAEVRHAAADLGWGSTLVLICGMRAEALLPDLLILQRRGLNIAVVLADIAEEDAARMRRYGIATYTITREGRPMAA